PAGPDTPAGPAGRGAAATACGCRRGRGRPVPARSGGRTRRTGRTARPGAAGSSPGWAGCCGRSRPPTASCPRCSPRRRQRAGRRSAPGVQRAPVLVPGRAGAVALPGDVRERGRDLVEEVAPGELAAELLTARSVEGADRHLER